jgi:cytochrome c biogenesis protein CcdA/thiol-disulfide isomerase/thioredoxin
MIVLLLFSVLAGLVTVASPCILPILPIVLTASVNEGRARPLALIAGLVISFTVFTLAISQVVGALGISPTALRIAAVAIIGLLGLGMFIPAFTERLELLFSRLTGLAPRTHRAGWVGGLMTGATLGIVWAPCAGPVLAAITTLAATQRVTLASAAVTAAYGLGVGIPLLLIAYGGRGIVRRIPTLARRSRGLQRGFGVVMVGIAVLMAFGADVTVTAWATGALPAGWNDRLQAFEDTPLARTQLDRLVGRTAAPVFAAAPNDTQPTAALPIAAAPSNASPPDGAAQAAVPGATVPPIATDRPTATPAPTATAAAEAMPMTTPMATLTAVPQPTQPPLDLPDQGPAPEFTGVTNWLNTQPLTLAALRGKVVLIDFWTYSCINCIRTLPYLTDWYAKYHDQGLVIVGVHAPEFAFERDTNNVKQAIARYGIRYPVAQDNDFATWNAYGNRYWPAEYFIDARGHVRYTHFGEGEYDQSERVIQQLLAEAGQTVHQDVTAPSAVPISGQQTPETYVGFDRQERFASPGKVMPGLTANYDLPSSLPLHWFGVGGAWTFEHEYAQSATGDTLRLHFYARDVYLVMSSDTPANVRVSLISPAAANQSEDVKTDGLLAVSQARLYHLVRLPSAQEGTVELHFEQPGVRVYAFTFGS